ncbi:MAG: hypothetical protein P9L97_07150 [Candidatus Tenebribacter davisii]|nr:hypothetical protein [Candidatus Tenebribacter davisii]
MKKLNLIFIIALLFSALLISCSKNSNISKISIEEIRAKLESEQTLETDTPFAVREFKPYLDGKWIGNAISYGCYRKGQAPGNIGPSKEEILEDLNIITNHWNLIRVYNADDDSERLLEVIRENMIPVKVMLGIWLANEEKDPETKKSNITNVLRCIELANKYPDIIAAVNVGNETQVFWSWHRMNSKNLIRYIRAVRNNITIPVTTADDYNFWNKPESKAVASEIDFIVTHIYPLWNGKTLDNAIPWLDENYEYIKINHPEKQLVLGEIGWATVYNADKKGDGEQGSLIKGEVSIKAQGKFLIELNKWVNDNQITTFFFEAFDEPWKGGGENSGPNEIEKNWGIFHEDRTPKESFQNYIIHSELKHEK